jgi:hypothetical protein
VASKSYLGVAGDDVAVTDRGHGGHGPVDAGDVLRPAAQLVQRRALLVVWPPENISLLYGVSQFTLGVGLITLTVSGLVG